MGWYFLYVAMSEGGWHSRHSNKPSLGYIMTTGSRWIEPGPRLKLRLALNAALDERGWGRVDLFFANKLIDNLHGGAAKRSKIERWTSYVL